MQGFPWFTSKQTLCLGHHHTLHIQPRYIFFLHRLAFYVRHNSSSSSIVSSNATSSRYVHAPPHLLCTIWPFPLPHVSNCCFYPTDQLFQQGRALKRRFLSWFTCNSTYDLKLTLNTWQKFLFLRFKNPISHEAHLGKLESEVIYKVRFLSSQLHIRYLMPSRSHASSETGNLVRTQTSRIVFTSKTSPKNKCCHYMGFGKSQYQGQRASVQGFQTESERLL